MSKYYELNDRSIVQHKHKDTWSCRYRGIGIEVCRWQDYEGKDKWNYYLYIYEAMIGDSYDMSGIRGSNCSHPFIHNIDFHYGCTFVEVNDSRHGRMFKLGCDYNHLWDQGMRYDLELVTGDAMEAVDSLYRNVDGIKVFNQKDGSWILATNAVCTAGGSCYERTEERHV